MRPLSLLLILSLIGGIAARADVSETLKSAEALRAKGDLKGSNGVLAEGLTRLTTSSPQEDRGRLVQALAETELSLGRYPDAAQHAGECATIFRALANPASEANCRTTVGRAEVLQGLYPAATKSFENARSVARSAGLRPSEVAILNNLGAVRYFVGDYSMAHALYQEASVILQQHEAEAWTPRMKQLTKANFAVLYQRLGQYQRALSIYGDMQSSPALRGSERSQMLANMGVLYRRLGDPYKAIEQYQSAQAILAEQKDSAGEIGIIKNTGIALAMDLADYRKAGDAFRKSLARAEAAANPREEAQAHLYQSETLRLSGQPEEAAKHAQRGLEIAGRIGSLEDQWKAHYALGRIAEDQHHDPAALQHYDQAIGIIESLRGTLADLSLRAGFLGDKRSVYDAAIRVQWRASSSQIPRLFHDIEQTRARTLKDKTRNPAVPLEQVEGRLPAGTALLEYWSTTTDIGVLWIANGKAGIRKIDPQSMSMVSPLVGMLRDGSNEWRKPALGLGKALLSEVLGGLPKPVTRLIIVPDGDLAAIPFEVLIPQQRTLIEDYAVSYLPSATMLPANRPETREWQLPWKRTLVAFADPVAPAGASDSLFTTALPPLPGARKEAGEIANVIGGRADIHAGADNLKVYVESGQLDGVPVVHFATHGIADEEDSERSRLAFSAARPGQPLDFLFAQEIGELSLGGARLVTLSACDTETGRSVAGEGVAALSRAFLSAGAPSVISTLWRVGDQSSFELMRRFYYQLSRGETVSDALRSAKLQLALSSGTLSHPRYWAAFVLNGDPQTTLPRNVPLAQASGALVIAAGLLWLLRTTRKRA